MSFYSKVFTHQGMVFDDILYAAYGWVRDSCVRTDSIFLDLDSGLVIHHEFAAPGVPSAPFPCFLARTIQIQIPMLGSNAK